MRSTPQRTVSNELLKQLDPVERIVAQAFINEGRWTVEQNQDSENK
jgi:hypothetical protein